MQNKKISEKIRTCRKPRTDHAYHLLKKYIDQHPEFYDQLTFEQKSVYDKIKKNKGRLLKGKKFVQQCLQVTKTVNGKEEKSIKVYEGNMTLHDVVINLP